MDMDVQTLKESTIGGVAKIFTDETLSQDECFAVINYLTGGATFADMGDDIKEMLRTSKSSNIKENVKYALSQTIERSFRIRY